MWDSVEESKQTRGRKQEGGLMKNTNMVRDIWNWVAERWLYFTVIGIVYLMIYYASGSPIQAVSGIVIFMLMCLGVIWVNRLPRDDRIFWKRLVRITMILLAITV